MEFYTSSSLLKRAPPTVSVCVSCLSLPGGLGFELCEEFQLPQLTLCVSVGCVERFTGDAIVNAANEACHSAGTRSHLFSAQFV